MPPQNARRPDEPKHAAALTALETALDAASAGARSGTHRYVSPAQPHGIPERDPRSAGARDRRRRRCCRRRASYGFDNVTVGDLSPTLLERYISAAQKISRLAVGRTEPSPAATQCASGRTSRRKTTSTGCRSAPGAARSIRTRFPRTANTKSRSV